MANKNRIRFARSVTRNNLPASLDYGEPGYVKNDRLIIGNDDGTEFIVNDWSSLKNKPDLAGLETTVAFTTDELIQTHRVVRIKPSNGRIVRASKNALSTARVIGIVTDETIAESTALVQSTGVVADNAWSWTPGDAIYLGNTVGGLTSDISGFADTDARCLIGIAISPTEILLTIQPPKLPHDEPDPVDPITLVQTITDTDTENAPSAAAVYSHVSTEIGAINLPPDLTSDLNTLDGRVTTVEGDVSGLEGRVDDIEDDITGLSTDVSTVTGDLDAVVTAVNTNITNINNLTSVVNGQIVQVVDENDTTHAPSGAAVYAAIDALDVSAGGAPFSDNVRTAGHFYTGTDDPVSTNRINFDGNLHVNDLHTNANSIYIGGNRLSTESGVLKYQPLEGQEHRNFELVVTELDVGGMDITGIKGRVNFMQGDLTFNQDQAGLTAPPARNVNITVERGNENNVAIRWNETYDRWEATSNGSTYHPFVFLNSAGNETTEPNRLLQWSNSTTDAVQTAPVSVSETAALTLHHHQAKIVVDRLGAGSNQEIAWNESMRAFTASAPLYAPNIPQIFQSANFLTASVPHFLLVHEAQSVQFDITISDRFSNIVRVDRLDAAMSNSDITWTRTTVSEIGDSSVITPEITRNSATTQLGFQIDSGSWYIVVRVTPTPFWNGLPITYSMGI